MSGQFIGRIVIAERGCERRLSEMKAADRITRMIGQTQQRQDQLDPCRVDNGTATFATGGYMQAFQACDQAAHFRIFSDQETDGGRRRSMTQPGRFSRGKIEQAGGRLLVLFWSRSSLEASVTGQLLFGCLVVLKPATPGLYGSLTTPQIRMARQVFKNSIHQFHNHG